MFRNGALSTTTTMMTAGKLILTAQSAEVTLPDNRTRFSVIAQASPCVCVSGVYVCVYVYVYVCVCV